jgi:hypothetical protein
MTRDEVMWQGGPQNSTDHHCAKSGWHVTTGEVGHDYEALHGGKWWKSIPRLKWNVARVRLVYDIIASGDLRRFSRFFF